MAFEDIAMINPAAVIRAARSTPYHGKRVIDRLTSEGRISPADTGTGRTALTPRDGETVYNELTK